MRAPETAARGRELLLRVGSAAVIVPATVVLTWLGTAPFAAVVAGIGVLTLFEWFHMMGARRIGGLHAAAGVALVLVGVGALLLPLPAALASIGLFAVLVAEIGRRTDVKHRLRPRAGIWCGLGFVYVGLPLVAFTGARAGEHGVAIVFFVIVVAAAADTCAYFTGRALGGPKLWRRVSPAKTWSGLVGGLVGGLLAGLAVAVLSGLPVNGRTLTLAVALALVAAAGDLLESAIKRHFGVKDTSRLIPGHGGVMDRIDGIGAAGVAALAVGAVANPVLGPSDALFHLLAGG